MNKKKLALTLATVLMMPSAFATYLADGTANNGTADDADDLQTVNLTVPEIALLQVEDTAVSLSIASTPANVPTVAGQGFTGSVSSASQALKISSNSEAGSSTGRILTASIAGALPTNWKLTITPTTSAGTAVAKDLVDATTSVDIVTDILNKRDAAGGIVYTFAPKADGDMMAFSADADAPKPVEITYTLSNI